MDFKILKGWIFLLVLLIIGISISCKGKKDCIVYHQVIFPLNMYALSDTVQIGDTVYLNIAFSRSLKDIMTDNFLYLPTDFIDHSISIYKIDKDSVELQNMNNTGGISSFDTINFVGNLSYNFQNFLRNISYVVTADSVFGRFGFIAKDTGTFVFYLTDNAWYKYKLNLEHYGKSLTNPECEEAYWHGLMVNQNVNNNYYIIEKRQVHFDTTKFWYYNLNASNPYNTSDPNNKNSMTDFKKNLQFGTFSVVVKDKI